MSNEPAARGRILHLIPTLEGGGAERQLAYLGRGLAERGWDVTVATLRGGGNSAMLEAAGITPQLIKHVNPRDPLLLPRILRLIQRNRADVVHTWLPSMDILGGFSASLLRVPWVASERTQPDSLPSGMRSRWRQKLLLGRAQVLVANSEKAAATYRRLGTREGLVRCIHNGVPIEALRTTTPAARSAAGLGEDVKVITLVGRLDQEKNIATVIRAAAQVLERVRIVLLVFGIGPYQEQLQALARDQGLEGCIRFEGYSEAVPSWLRSADLFVSASHFEGSPNAVMEAMACGCPMVLSNIEEHRGLAGGGALYFEPRDHGALADHMISALADPRSTIERTRTASSLIAKYTIERMTSLYEEVYSELLA